MKERKRINWFGGARGEEKQCNAQKNKKHQEKIAIQNIMQLS
jgi:hypothetical protein